MESEGAALRLYPQCVQDHIRRNLGAHVAPSGSVQVLLSGL